MRRVRPSKSGNDCLDQVVVSYWQQRVAPLSLKTPSCDTVGASPLTTRLTAVVPSEVDLAIETRVRGRSTTFGRSNWSNNRSDRQVSPDGERVRSVARIVRCRVG
jgi:hypothetical protein